MKRSCNFHFILPIELLEKLETKVKEKKFVSIVKAIRSYIKIGMHVESYKTIIKDPEFLKSIEELKTNQKDRSVQTKPNTDNEYDVVAGTEGE